MCNGQEVLQLEIHQHEKDQVYIIFNEIESIKNINQTNIKTSFRVVQQKSI